MTTARFGAKRVILSTDHLGSSRDDLRRLLGFCRGTGVVIQLGSFIELYGLRIIEEIGGFGLSVYADLNLFLTPQFYCRTLDTLKYLKPHFLTVNLLSDPATIKHLKDQLPSTKLVGVLVTTRQSDQQQALRSQIDGAFGACLGHLSMTYAQTRILRNYEWEQYSKQYSIFVSEVFPGSVATSNNTKLGQGCYLETAFKIGGKQAIVHLPTSLMVSDTLIRQIVEEATSRIIAPASV